MPLNNYAAKHHVDILNRFLYRRLMYWYEQSCCLGLNELMFWDACDHTMTSEKSEWKMSILP